MLRRELVFFLVAVLVGSLAGVATSEILKHWISASATGNASLAIAATFAAATHHRLVHGQSLRLLAPKVVVAAPLAFVVMRAVHVVIGS